MSTVCLPTPERTVVAHIQSRFGRVLREARRARGWSQEVLADLADLNRSYIGEIERGSVIASIVTLQKLADALEIPPSSLLARCESVAK